MIVISSALEDYIETLYLLKSNNNILRVKDIVKAKNVKASSVTQALQRLLKLELIDYKQRDHIELTKNGLELAQKLHSKYILIYKFLNQILEVTNYNASKDACLIEHYLSYETTEKLTRFFEYINHCKKEKLSFFEDFKTCSLVNPNSKKCKSSCHISNNNSLKLSKVIIKQKLVIDHISIDNSKIRKKLIALGLIPGNTIQINEINDNTYTVIINNYKINLKKNECSKIFVKPIK